MKPIIVIPTYNESDNIKELVSLIRTHVDNPNLEILVVDSTSPDDTASVVRELKKEDSKLHLLSQPGKLGLGKAYLDGMAWALKKDYDCLIMMDADLSHHPRYLASMLEKIKKYDLVIGSRYIKGGGLENWPIHRRILSVFANWYARTLIGLPLYDLTSGFNCFRTSLLRKILQSPIRTEGYTFLIELKRNSVLMGASIQEIPIIFTNRRKGSSKISKRVIVESIFFVLKCSLNRFWRKKP